MGCTQAGGVQCGLQLDIHPRCCVVKGLGGWTRSRVMGSGGSGTGIWGLLGGGWLGGNLGEKSVGSGKPGSKDAI